jgi:16S rRNA (guanine966-N2)-methyltransferase
MRIIAGKYRSRRIHSAHPGQENCIQSAKSSYRPTTDRAKESLFNTLNNIIDFDSVACLDLFAGSGALGFEALSRGGASCDFVESSSLQLKSIIKTADDLKVTEQVTIHNSNALDFLSIAEGRFYDIIFADPPYQFDKYDVLLQKVFNINFSIFVLEHSGISGMMYDTNRFNELNKVIGITHFKIFSTKDD